MSLSTSPRDQFRPFPLDDGLLLFHPPTGTNIRLSGQRVQGLRRTAPRVVMFGITNVCNLRCAFCSRDPSAASTWTEDTAFDLLAGLSQAGTLEVAFGGGEPFAFKGFASLLRRLYAQTPLAMHVTTNGTLIDEASWRDYAGLLGHVRVSIYDDVVWRRCAAVFARAGQRWGANLLVDDAALDALPARLRDLAEAGCDDVSLLGYVGEPDRILSPTGRRRLADIIAGSPVVCRVSVCFGGELAVPRLMAGFDNAGDCGAGSDFISVLPNQRVQSCSFQAQSWPASTAEQVLEVWRSKRISLAEPTPRSGCSRASPHAMPIEPLPEIAVWKGYSGNNSGECVLVGRFASADKAQACLEELLPGFRAVPLASDGFPAAWCDLFHAEGVSGPGMTEWREPPDELLVLGSSLLAFGYGAGDNFPELRALAWKRGAAVSPGGIHLHDDPTLFVAMRTRDPADERARWAAADELGMQGFMHGRVLFLHGRPSPDSSWSDLAAGLEKIADGAPLAAELHLHAFTDQQLMEARQQQRPGPRATRQRLLVRFGHAAEKGAVEAYVRILEDQRVYRGADWVMIDPVWSRERLAVLAYRRGASVSAYDAESLSITAYLWRPSPPPTKGKKAVVAPMPTEAEVLAELATRDAVFQVRNVVTGMDYGKLTLRIATTEPGRAMQSLSRYAGQAGLSVWLQVEEPDALRAMLQRMRRSVGSV